MTCIMVGFSVCYTIEPDGGAGERLFPTAGVCWCLPWNCAKFKDLLVIDLDITPGLVKATERLQSIRVTIKIKNRNSFTRIKL